MKAAGKRLYRNVDQTAFARQADDDGGFWIAFADALSSHPNLPKRVAAVQDRVRATKHASQRVGGVAVQVQQA